MDTYRYNLPQLFAATVRSYGDRPAIQFSESAVLTYKELHRISNQVARLLRDRGVGPGDRICISSEKSIVPYAVILGALKVGATYFAIDPGNPILRTRKILDQCNPKLVFADNDPGFDSSDGSIIWCEPWFDRFPPAEGYEASEPDSSAIDGCRPAYIMFTSGSTGTPKGAVISHSNLVHFAHWARQQYRFTPDDRHTNINPIYFDNSVFDIYSTFFSGGCLVPFAKPLLSDPPALVAQIERMACTTFFSVPSLLMYLQVMKQIRREPLRSLRRIIFGGEGYPKVKLKALYDELKGQCELINVYGPTECTCICSSHTISEADFRDLEGLPTLGQLIPNFRGHLLVGDQEPEPGEAAELCLGGPCVGLGYFGQNEATERAFVQNPLNPFYRERIYRTGDLVRHDWESGGFNFVGRKDLQIKHQGYRIELEEIQHSLISLHQVDEAAVLHSRDSGLSQLVAVVASKAPQEPQMIKEKLGEHLPNYMVPDRIYVVDALPKNPNGKTDRQRLMAEFLKA